MPKDQRITNHSICGFVLPECKELASNHDIYELLLPTAMEFGVQSVISSVDCFSLKLWSARGVSQFIGTCCMLESDQRTFINTE